MAGIVISASHNPYYDNGIKIFSSLGFKLNDQLETEIEELVLSGKINEIAADPEDIGRAKRIDDAAGKYVEFCKSTFPPEYSLKGTKVVLDCANGASYHIAPDIYEELGAEVTVIHSKPNGFNINDKCGSQFTHDLCEKVKEVGADIGFAFDGDADRLIAVDENGNEIDGDHVIAICAKQMLDNGTLTNKQVIVTPMSNLGLRVCFNKLGIECKNAGIGDRLVLEKMKQEGAILGGEQSGHVIFLNKHTTGDGIVTSLQLISAIKQSGKPLSELAKIFETAPQVLINIDVKDKPELDTLPEVSAAIKAAEEALGDMGRILVRYSGTQPMCRVMVEASSIDIANSISTKIADLIRKTIGK